MQLTRYFCEQDTEFDLLGNPENILIRRSSRDVIEHITLIRHILKTHPYMTCIRNEKELENLTGFFFVSNTVIYFLSGRPIQGVSHCLSELDIRKATSKMLGGFFEKPI